MFVPERKDVRRGRTIHTNISSENLKERDYFVELEVSETYLKVRKEERKSWIA